MSRRQSYLFVMAACVLAGTVAAADRDATSETSIGIFYQPGAPTDRKLWRPDDPGQRLLLKGKVLTLRGRPIEGARVELWHADGNGIVHESRYRASLETKEDGSFGVSTVRPGYIPGAPDVWGARHIHVVVNFPGYERLVTLVLFKGDPKLEPDMFPELAVPLEEGRIKDETVFFADVDFILRKP